MTASEPPAFEMDMGEEPAAKPASDRIAPADQISTQERDEHRRLSELRTQMVAHMDESRQIQNFINLDALALAGLCGQGLCAALRVDSWAGWVPMAFLATLASLAWVVWMWRRTLNPILKMAALPLPLDDTSASRSFSLDAAQRDQARKRREQDITNIELCVNELSVLRPRLRGAVRGACWGAVCGWVIGFMSPAGIVLLAGSAAAGVASASFWFAAKGTWSMQLIRQIILFGVPGVALVVSLACGHRTLWPGAWPIIGMAIVVAAGWHKQRELLRLSKLVPADGIPDYPASKNADPVSGDAQKEADH